MIVTKFGGSSLADAAQFKKVKTILEMDSERKFVVPSAPGKRGPGDDKITDLLYAAHKAASAGKAYRHLLERIQARYEEIAGELHIDFDLKTEKYKTRMLNRYLGCFFSKTELFFYLPLAIISAVAILIVLK